MWLRRLEKLEEERVLLLETFARVAKLELKIGPEGSVQLAPDGLIYAQF